MSIYILILLLSVYLLFIIIVSVNIRINYHLKAYNRIKNYDSNHISITFDDGPNLDYTPKVLNLLKKYNAKATFFCIGKNIEIVAAYETLSETHWNAPHIEPNFTPNWVIDISDHIEKKLMALKCYKSQIYKFPSPRSIKAAEALANFRGTQAGFGYGEGMHIIRKIS